MKKFLLFLCALSALHSSLLFAKPIILDELLGTQLIGLDIDKPKAKSIYKKYFISFGTACYGGETNLFISKNRKFVYLYNSFEKFNEKKLPEGTETLKIVSINETNSTVSIVAKSEQFGDFEFNFSTDDSIVYKLQIKNPISKDNAEAGQLWSDFRPVYVKQKDKKKFVEQSCGDFEG